MIKVKSKTLWKGMVAIRDKYIKKAKLGKHDIQITHNQETMLIPCKEIDKKTIMRSELISDNFSKEMHRLVYFKWTIQPPNKSEEDRQKMLLGF